MNCTKQPVNGNLLLIWHRTQTAFTFVQLTIATHCILRHWGHATTLLDTSELANTHRREVPRMLVTRGEQAALERYIMRAKDTELMRWWAGYCESLGHIDSAQHCYESVGDYYSLVRVACFSNQTNHAVEIIGQSFSAAGAYHLARHFEGCGDINKAIHYFAKSGCYHHAIRLARQYQLDVNLCNSMLVQAFKLIVLSILSEKVSLRKLSLPPERR